MLRVYHSNRLDVLEALMEFIVERLWMTFSGRNGAGAEYRHGAVAAGTAARFGITANISSRCRELYLDMFVRVLKDIRAKALQQAEHELEADDPPAQHARRKTILSCCASI